MGSQINPCVVVSFSESCHNMIALVCKGYKLGVMWLGAPFPLQSSAGPHHLLIQEGRLSQYTSDFSMQSCISDPCFNFLPHQCSPYPTLSISAVTKAQLLILREVRRVKCWLSWGMCAKGWKDPAGSSASFFLPSTNGARAPCSLNNLSWAQFNSPPLLGGSGHMWSRQVSCLLSLRHQWSFSCATTVSSLTKVPHEICRWGVQAALHRLLRIWLLSTPPIGTATLSVWALFQCWDQRHLRVLCCSPMCVYLCVQPDPNRGNRWF